MNYRNMDVKGGHVLKNNSVMSTAHRIRFVQRKTKKCVRIFTFFTFS